MIGTISGTRVLLPAKSELEGFFGKESPNGFELSLVEAYYLLKKGKLTLKFENKKLNEKIAFSLFCGLDAEFPQKDSVFTDLRERGFVVKTGFKFGTHFRVYERGVNPYKDGSKTQKEHTKWVVHAVPEDYGLSYAEMSRAVRLAQNIRAKMLWAVVDSENG